VHPSNFHTKKVVCLSIFSLLVSVQCLRAQLPVRLIPVGDGWANNSVNTVVFRKNSVVTWRDAQFVAYYDSGQYLVIAMRRHGSDLWVTRKTGYRGNALDAHNSISIMVDGDGFLHVAWDHHNTPLRYCKSLTPASMDLSPPVQMTGIEDQRVSYPEFYRLPNGDLLFLYRSGESGKGNLVINRYYTKEKRWELVHKNLIDGEGIRNAYWQFYSDNQGTIHLSWVWRESADVSSNHDLCYARSRDGGHTWENSEGKKYVLPITSATAEYACKISQGSELINQTSMSADEKSNPFIATYWRTPDSSIPQYRIVYKKGSDWKKLDLDFRTTAFSLSGMGTKRIPIARPQFLVSTRNGKSSGWMIFRDEERKSMVSLVAIDDVEKRKWKVYDLTKTSVESWEPTYDTEYWKTKGILHLFVQKVHQADLEGKTSSAPELIQILEWIPDENRNRK
jgi:hypothetical protein